MKLMRWIAIFTIVIAGAANATTVNNDDSCDIAVLPAATLLLPYFEVDLHDPRGETTLFTVTNVTNLDQIARVTLWTDYGFPVFGFNVYLTGYDVQAINVYDILSRGVIAPDGGTGTSVSKRRMFSDVNAALDLRSCDRLPGALDPSYVARMQNAFTLGSVPADQIPDSAACRTIGGVHSRAIGYATVDVVRRCGTNMPIDAAYWTDDIRYDNVLIGDYQQINSHENFAQGGSMVHIRAIPDGTPAGRARAANAAGFEQTFYGRYQSATTPHLDGRQPLPSTFATRWISGGPSEYQTSMKVWREGQTDSATSCDEYRLESRRRVTEVVVFDEDENAVTLADDQGRVGVPLRPELPSTSRTVVSDDSVYPHAAGGRTSGWMYFNLDHTRGDAAASQNWVISSMRASGRFSTDVDAIALGNGCSAPADTTSITAAGGPPIGPSGGVGSQPTRLLGNASLAPRQAESQPLHLAATNNDDSCDVALLPAATLLLPYFEIDLDDRAGETTLVAVTNVSPSDQIARVTLWTDYAYPVLTFNVYLTGYDVQSINLYDVIERGLIAPDEGTGTRVTARGEDSVRNDALDLSACRSLPGSLPKESITRMQQAFTLGRVPGTPSTAGCNVVGNVHDNAVGYATIDVVGNCSSNIPTNPQYWSDDLRYDNVLIGDYQQINGKENFAQGATMVHVRAIPEGGTPATRGPSPFAHTFYSRLQSRSMPLRDGRQPLPTTFAARWIQGGAASLQTSYKVWREGKTGIDATCAQLPDNGGLRYIDIVRFDEAENGVGDVPISRVCTPLTLDAVTPATSRTSVSDSSVYPQLTNGAVGGWMYLNLDNCDQDSHGSSNWVVTSMRAEGRYSVDMDAAALGNGCSRPLGESEVTTGTLIIGPAANTP